MVRMEKLRQAIDAARRVDKTIRIVRIERLRIVKYRNWIEVYMVGKTWTYVIKSEYLRKDDRIDTLSELFIGVDRMARADVRRMAELEKKEIETNGY